MTHLHAIPPELETYIGRRELAARLGVSVRQVDYFVEMGMPSYCWGIRRRVFLWSEAQRWARDRDRRAA